MGNEPRGADAFRPARSLDGHDGYRGPNGDRGVNGNRGSGSGRSYPEGRRRRDDDANGSRGERHEWQDPYASSSGRTGQSPRSAPAGGPDDLSLAPWPDGGRPRGPRNGDSRTNGRDAGPRDPGPRNNAPRDSGAPTAAGVPADLRELVRQILTASQAAEGRNMFGSYGSSGLTPVIQRIAAQLPYGGLAPGSEENTLKPADRLGAKLAKLIARNPGRPPEELARSISDAIRYAFTFDPADYTEGTWLVHRKLKAHGFELEVRRNRWESPEYRGIFTRWRDPAHGQAFEIQFHTMASWAVARRTHDAYVQLTDPAAAPADRARLRARLASAAAEAKPPDGYLEIADFRLESR